MDSFELNKLLGALLGALFIVFSVSLISDTIFYSPTPATPRLRDRGARAGSGGRRTGPKKARMCWR